MLAANLKIRGVSADTFTIHGSMVTQLLDGFRVLLVDDHPLFREGLVLTLEQRVPSMLVKGVASFSAALEEMGEGVAVYDLTIIDYRLPGMHGLDCAIQLRARFPQMACVLMSGSDDMSLPERARQLGLAGFFPKSLEVDRLIEGLCCLARGETYYSSVGSNPISEGLPGLTKRQQEIVRLAADGATNKTIAQSLGIAPHTVKNHLAHIFSKLGAGNRAQAVSIAMTASQPSDSDGR